MGQSFSRHHFVDFDAIVQDALTQLTSEEQLTPRERVLKRSGGSAELHRYTKNDNIPIEALLKFNVPDTSLAFSFQVPHQCGAGFDVGLGGGLLDLRTISPMEPASTYPFHSQNFKCTMLAFSFTFYFL